MRAIPLADQSEGINLLRSKGGASPQGLFDLVNGWVTPKRTINARPGTVAAASFPSGTKGVVGFENKFHTFASNPATVSDDPNVVVHILRRSDGSASALTKVHRAFPFLGRLYVVAEYADGAVRHFWLELPVTWSANKVYAFGQKVLPTTNAGFYYAIEGVSAVAAWQENSVVVVGDFKQPKITNNFKYELTAGTGPSGFPLRTSETEPTWPTTDGATVIERRFVTSITKPPGSGTPTGGGDGGSSALDEYGHSYAGRSLGMGTL